MKRTLQPRPYVGPRASDSDGCSQSCTAQPARPADRASASARRLTLAVCAGHGARLPGWKSSDQVYEEPTCLRAARRQEGRRRARASSRGFGVSSAERRGLEPACRHRQGSPIRRCGATCLRLSAWYAQADATHRQANRNRIGGVVRPGRAGTCLRANAQAGVTAKPSIHAGACFINPAFTHRRSCVLPREVCTVSTGRVD